MAELLCQYYGHILFVLRVIREEFRLCMKTFLSRVVSLEEQQRWLNRHRHFIKGPGRLGNVSSGFPYGCSFTAILRTYFVLWVIRVNIGFCSKNIIGV